MSIASQQITPFLTFFGQAEEAMQFYVSLFGEESAIVHVVRQEDGKVLQGAFRLRGQTYMCSDSMLKHEWTFTPGVSFFVTCKSEEEIARLFEGLSEGGKVHMPLGDYGFSRKFGWTDDRFGVSWQLNLDRS